MRKLLVINSFGPMGSTLLSGLCEKLGFTNIPLRKLGLHGYLTGATPLESGLMQTQLQKALTEHAKPGLRGGVSVLDRNNQEPKPLLDAKKAKESAEKAASLNAKTVEDLYFACRNLYGDAVSYKNLDSDRDWQIELTTDIHRYDHAALYRAYNEQFADVKMIHLHRPFAGWINSLASQAFVHPEWKHRIKFFPHKRHADYRLYEEAVAAMPGMDLPFDDLFAVPLEKLAADIAAFAGVPAPACDLRAQSYDLYGKITPCAVAFKKFDDNIEFLRPATRDWLQHLAQSGKIGAFPYSAAAWTRYLADMARHNAKAAK